MRRLLPVAGTGIVESLTTERARRLSRRAFLKTSVGATTLAVVGGTVAGSLSEQALAKPTSLKKAVAGLERELILRALDRTGGNKSRAADLLHINRRQLFAKLKQLKISLPRKKAR